LEIGNWKLEIVDSVEIKHVILFFLLLMVSVAGAQEADTLPGSGTEPQETNYEASEEDYVLAERAREPYHPPQLEPLAARKVDAQRWDEASGTLDYSKDVPEPVEESAPRTMNAPDINPGFDWTAATQGLGSFFQALAVIVAAGAIAFGIWRMLQAPRNRQIARDGVEITLDNLDEYLHETDLERFLREALAQGNYTLAVRLYYLQIIKNLSEKNALRWSREKTNRDYLRELRGHRMADTFREVTRVYERVWYGNLAIGAEEYAALEPGLKRALAAV
jgi:hypothetical protein